MGMQSVAPPRGEDRLEASMTTVGLDFIVSLIFLPPLSCNHTINNVSLTGVDQAVLHSSAIRCNHYAV